MRHALIFPLIAMAVLAGTLLFESHRLFTATRWVDHTDQVISDSRLLLRRMIGNTNPACHGTVFSVFLPFSSGSELLDLEKNQSVKTWEAGC